MLDPQYPVGKFERPGELDDARRRHLIEGIAAAPAHLRSAVAGLTAAQLATPYRPGGWTVQQVTHHLADSHLNAYVRTRLALTEQEPTAKGYDEKRWAELEDARTAPVELSMDLLDRLHQRWVWLLRSLSTADYRRAFRHTELGLMDLNTQVALYEWHGRHHVAHITSLRQRMGWT